MIRLFRLSGLFATHGEIVLSALSPKRVLLIQGEEFEVVIIKAMRVVVFDLLSVCESDGPGLDALILGISIRTPVVLMFVIVLLLGSCLLNSPHVLAFVVGVRVPADNVRFDVSHGLHAGAVWPVLHFVDNDWMNVVWIWVPDPFWQGTDLHFFWGSLPTFSSHNGVCIVE